MMFKKFIALAVVATMVAGSSLTAFAADDEGVTGQGVVEFDDSTDIKYDQVQVPTLAASTYDFKMDPTGVISAYGGEGDETFEASKYIFFHGTQTRESVKAKAVGTLYKEEYDEFTKTDGTYKNLVTVATITEGKITAITTVADLYLWVPDAAYANGSGLSGKYLAITKDNVEDYFTLSVYDTNKVQADFRADHKAGANVCDGKVYKKIYTSTIGTADTDNKVVITDSDADPLSQYVTVVNDAITEVKGIYKDNTGATAATKDDFDYVAAVTRYQATSDSVYVKNLSTKAKTVTAKVTLKDATGLTINGSDTFTSVADKAAIYVGVYNAAKSGGAGYTALAADNGVVTATITVPLAAVTDNGVTTYQTTELNKLGGHKYSRFSGPNPNYTSNYFNITAAINPAGNDKTADVYKAWVKYFEDAEVAPSLNIVYSVKNTNTEDDDTPTAPSITTKTYKYTSGQALVIPVNLGAGNLAATGINRITYVNASGVSTALATTNWSYANGKITIAESYITALAGANVTRDYKVTFNDEDATQVVLTLKP